jgi:tRNA pseudouridine38/39 synthase
MVAILFMVGQGLEEPSIVTELLDVERTPRRPMYTMADDVPLVLWDCIFPELDDKGNGVSRADTIDWIYVGDDDVRTKYGVKGIMDVLWEGWRSSMMDEFLSARLLGLVAAQGKDVNTGVAAESEETETKNDARRSKPRLFFGGNTWEGRGAYVPLMKRTLQQSPDEQNEKHAVKMGYGSSAEMKKAKGYR